jgi:hypothetical protein
MDDLLVPRAGFEPALDGLSDHCHYRWATAAGADDATRTRTERGFSALPLSLGYVGS